MTTLQNQQDIPESHLKEAQVENDMLLVQIHQLEAILRTFFYKRLALIT